MSNSINMMTVAEVAKKLNVAKKTIYNWSKNGEIPSYQIGQGLRFDKSEIEEWLKNKRRVKEID